MKKLMYIITLLMAANSWAINYSLDVHNAIELSKSIKISKQVYSLTFYGEPGDWVSGGRFRMFEHDPRLYSLNGNNHHVRFNMSDYTWFDINLVARYDDPLEEIMYTDALRYPFNGKSHPGLSFDGDGRGCNELSGRFKILEYQVDESGKPIKLAADFEQHCEKGKSAAFGSVRFNSSFPVIPNPAIISDGKLIAPLVKIDNEDRTISYKAIIMHEISSNSGQFIVDALLPSELRDEEIKVPATFNEDSHLFILPSVMSLASNGKAEEFEVAFYENPKNIEVGSVLTLSYKKEIRS